MGYFFGVLLVGLLLIGGILYGFAYISARVTNTSVLANLLDAINRLFKLKS